MDSERYREDKAAHDNTHASSSTSLTDVEIPQQKDKHEAPVLCIKSLRAAAAAAGDGKATHAGQHSGVWACEAQHDDSRQDFRR